MRSLLSLSLEEDVGSGDLTTLSVVPTGLAAEGSVVAKQELTISGLGIFEPLVESLRQRANPDEEAESLRLVEALDEGSRVGPGTVLCRVQGTARALLIIERTFLNFLGRMSGVATLTSEYVSVVAACGSATRILDTRKTTPGHRLLEKFAVRCGGGTNHRMGLFDAVLIKDNHIVAAGGVAKAIFTARSSVLSGVKIEVECDTSEQIEEALAEDVDAILLDNMSPDQVRRAVELVDGRARTEISGGVTMETLEEYARAGADDISIGRLTHSAPSADIGLDLALAK